MSSKFKMIRDYYDLGLWCIDRVRVACVKKLITESEFYEITGIKID